MKITIVQGAFFPVPPLLGGAVEKVWFALGKEFARRGHSVVHISRQYKDLPHEEVIEGVKHIRLPGFAQPRNLLYLKTLDFLYSWKVLAKLPQADILVTNTFWLPLLLNKSTAGKLYVHIQRYPRGQMRFYKKASRLQPVSHAVANAIIAQNPECADKIKVIPNPVPELMDSSDPGLPPAQRTKEILYVGRIHPEKGIALLLKAFSYFVEKNSQWRLKIIGPWEVQQGGYGPEYKEQLQNEYKNIEGKVDWLGPIFDSKELQAHYRQAAIFVYPSLAEKGEALPVAPIEAMASGCLTVVSDLTCFRDYLQEGKNGFVFALEGETAATNLAAVLYKVASQIESPAINAIARDAWRTSGNFSLAKIADLYLADFQSLLN